MVFISFYFASVTRHSRNAMEILASHTPLRPYGGMACIDPPMFPPTSVSSLFYFVWWAVGSGFPPARVVVPATSCLSDPPFARNINSSSSSSAHTPPPPATLPPSPLHQWPLPSRVIAIVSGPALCSAPSAAGRTWRRCPATSHFLRPLPNPRRPARRPGRPRS